MYSTILNRIATIYQQLENKGRTCLKFNPEIWKEACNKAGCTSDELLNYYTKGG